MKKLHIATAGLLVGVPLILLSPPVQADGSSFVSEAKALGFQQASDNLISTARSACYFLDRNRPTDQVTNRIARYLAVDAGLASRFFAMSVNEYCPQYRDRIGG